MIYKKYGVDLVRLEKGQLELLRQWRNAPEIAKNMEFQEYITPEMQEKWFRTINNIHHFYFLIKKDNEWVGLIHLSNISFDEKTADAGIFISNQSYINTSIPAYASFALLDFAFMDIKLKSIHIKVNKNNKKALKYNQHLGFLYSSESTNPEFILMKLNKKKYEEKSTRIRNIILNKFNQKTIIELDSSQALDKKIKELFYS